MKRRVLFDQTPASAARVLWSLKQTDKEPEIVLAAGTADRFLANLQSEWGSLKRRRLIRTRKWIFARGLARHCEHDPRADEYLLRWLAEFDDARVEDDVLQALCLECDACGECDQCHGFDARAQDYGIYDVLDRVGRRS